MQIKKIIKNTINLFGYDIIRKDISNSLDAKNFPIELNDFEVKLVNDVLNNKLTMVPVERLWVTALACKYAITAGINGDFVECGVWRGGNSILAAKIFGSFRENRRIYLFDTFEGMTAPSQYDTSLEDGSVAEDTFKILQKDHHNEWCYASEDDVRSSFMKMDCLDKNIKFVRGDVIRTLDNLDVLPEKISVLRLDTDWYESTKKELEVLYPRLENGGILILDDYGCWSGAKKAVDEFFQLKIRKPYLHYVDTACRLAIKYE